MSEERSVYTVQEAAEQLGVGEKNLFKLMRQLRIIDAGNTPFPQYVEERLLFTRPRAYKNKTTGITRHYRKTFVTRKGLKWLKSRIDEQVA